MKPISEAVKKPNPFALSSADRVVVTILLVVAGLFIVDRAQALESIRFAVTSMVGIAPFFLIAILFAGYAKASGVDQLIARAFAGRTEVAIVAASLVGALSPFCSCGVIPLIAAMLASGVPLAPVMAFCISSPIMDPEMFILTAAGIHLNFAIAKTATAFGLGLIAGFTVYGLQKWQLLGQPLKKSVGCGCGSAKPSFDPHVSVQVSWRFWQHFQRKNEFFEVVRANGLFLGKWMLLAFLIESIMMAYVPAEWIAGFTGSGSWMAIPLSAVVGVPAYMNGYAAIPLISGLLKMGMSLGAALAFATAGAVSSIPAALAVFALVKRRVFILYILLGFSGSLLAGYIYQFSSTF
jgi:uncharacterized membrane protein YraQ (UPF0718 family)